MRVDVGYAAAVFEKNRLLSNLVAEKLYGSETLVSFSVPRILWQQQYQKDRRNRVASRRRSNIIFHNGDKMQIDLITAS